MKNLITLLLFISITAQGQKSYYVSANGNDNADGSLAAPIKTLSKVNSLSLSSGDKVLFASGDQFYGFLIANKPGVTYTFYGSGASPVITGFTDLNGWTSIGTNLWESQTISKCNLVSIGGVNTPMGRTPNTGYYSMSATGFSSATISQLSGTENYKGAELIAKTTSSWITSRNLITSQNSKTLNTVPNYPNPANYTLYNFGSQGFIQNALSTLDKQNEWYYNPSTKKLDIYSVGQPSVRAATIDSLVRISAANVTIDGIDFLGANTDAIQVLSSGAKITNCNIRYCGDMGIQQGNNAPNPTITNCTFRDIENSGITDVYTGGNSFRTVTGNTFVNISMIEGSMGSLDGQNMVICSFNPSGTGDLVQNNSIDSCGYSAIFMMGQSYTVQNNLINHYCFYNTDGGAIYTGNKGTARNIIGNIILNGMTSNAHGVYVDDNGSNVNITGNSVYRAVNGIYLHNAHEITVKGNTVYNCSSASLSIGHGDGNDLSRNTAISNNIFVITSSNVNLGNCSYQTSETSETNFGTSDNNYIASPVKSDINAWFTAQKGATFNHYSLSQWQAKSGYDKSSKPSPKIVSSVDSLRFEYNATSVPVTVSLGATYIDMPGVSYPGSITLQPYSSAVLIKNGGSVTPPPQVFKNVTQSKAFTKNNCTSGTGTSVTYIVAAGKYSANTQAAADQLATTDINNNGQNYANLNGTCSPRTIIKVVIFYSDGSQVTQQ